MEVSRRAALDAGGSGIMSGTGDSSSSLPGGEESAEDSESLMVAVVLGRCWYGMKSAVEGRANAVGRSSNSHCRLRRPDSPARLGAGGKAIWQPVFHGNTAQYFWNVVDGKLRH